MSSTLDAFRRGLAKAFSDAVTEEVTGLLVTEAWVSLHFALIGETPQRVGALQLCTLRTEITVLQGDVQAANELLARIDRATQRGGG